MEAIRDSAKSSLSRHCLYGEKRVNSNKDELNKLQWYIRTTSDKLALFMLPVCASLYSDASRRDKTPTPRASMSGEYGNIQCPLQAPD